MKTILFILLIGFVHPSFAQDLDVSVLPSNKNSARDASLSKLSTEEILNSSDKTRLFFGIISKEFQVRNIKIDNSKDSNHLRITDSCSAIMNRISYFWIKDSLANNGFRALNFQDFLTCKVDNLTPEYLMLRLGKPNKIRETSHGIQYEYYYYDDHAMPENDTNRPGACGYILFSFSKKNKFIEVGEGVIDY